MLEATNWESNETLDKQNLPTPKIANFTCTLSHGWCQGIHSLVLRVADLEKIGRGREEMSLVWSSGCSEKGICRKVWERRKTRKT